MRTKKKFIMLLTTLILLASFLLGCFVIYHFSWREKTITLDTDYLELLTTEEAKDKKSLLLDYCSENTIGYLNNDGTKSLYIYSSPINFRDENNKLITIDTRIKNVSQKTKREQGYIYTVNKNDIIPFYPQNIQTGVQITDKENNNILIEFPNSNHVLARYKQNSNLIGEYKPTISYQTIYEKNTNLNFHPTSEGTNIELDIINKKYRADFQFTITLKAGYRAQASPAGYITILRKTKSLNGESADEVWGMIQEPIIKERNDTYKDFIQNHHFLSCEPLSENKYLITFHLGDYISKFSDLEYPIKLQTSVSIHKEHQSDSAVYSKQPNLNSYLSQYSIIGDSEKLGKGHTRIRFQIPKSFKENMPNIIRATYHTYYLGSGNENQFELISLLDDWCSTTSNWSTILKKGERVSLQQSQKGEIKFNITEEVKKWCKDFSGKIEHRGLLLKMANEIPNTYILLASHDHSLLRTRTEIIYQ